MWLFHFIQMFAMYFLNRIQKYPSFATKLGPINYYEGCCSIRPVFVCIEVIDLYDLLYSLMFEAKEYSRLMDEDFSELFVDDGEHNNPELYKWSYSLSFAVSHFILWSLCCVNEFIVKYDAGKRAGEPSQDGDDDDDNEDEEEDEDDDDDDGNRGRLQSRSVSDAEHLKSPRDKSNGSTRSKDRRSKSASAKSATGKRPRKSSGHGNDPDLQYGYTPEPSKPASVVSNVADAGGDALKITVNQ